MTGKWGKEVKEVILNVNRNWAFFFFWGGVDQGLSCFLLASGNFGSNSSLEVFASICVKHQSHLHSIPVWWKCARFLLSQIKMTANMGNEYSMGMSINHHLLLLLLSLILLLFLPLFLVVLLMALTIFGWALSPFILSVFLSLDYIFYITKWRKKVSQPKQVNTIVP